MMRIALGFWSLLLVGALVLAACGSSKSTNTPSNTPTTSGASVTTAPQSNASTPCTIPQNNGGDHDADNNGGPNDGDGCDR
jgi:ABC-type glycerol-3-phosphate transport system substrate-binding protein